MGGGGGGSSHIDLSKLTTVAEERLRQLAQSGTSILFACEKEDRKALDSHLMRSKVFDATKYGVTDSSAGSVNSTLIDRCSVVIVFTDNAKQTSFLDAVVERSLEKKKQGIHAKTTEGAQIPMKATAYRWPSLLWEKLEEMFS